MNRDETKQLIEELVLGQRWIKVHWDKMSLPEKSRYTDQRHRLLAGVSYHDAIDVLQDAFDIGEALDTDKWAQTIRDRASSRAELRRNERKRKESRPPDQAQGIPREWDAMVDRLISLLHDDMADDYDAEAAEVARAEYDARIGRLQHWNEKCAETTSDGRMVERNVWILDQFGEPHTGEMTDEGRKFWRKRCGCRTLAGRV